MDKKANLREKAERLRALHQGPSILVFANVWDVASARVVEKSGAPALATSSGGIANTLGYADGERIPVEQMLWMVQRIADAVRVPVTADIEAGYATTPDGMTATTERLLETGAVGLNLEDHHPREEALVDLSLQLEKIHAVLEAARKYGVPLILNARTDVFMPGVRAHGYTDLLEEAVRRANAYRAAGADCIFLPAVTEIEVIREFLARSPGPLNILATPQSPSIHELELAGVQRVSMGSGPHRAAVGFHKRLVAGIMESGSFAALGEGAPSYVEMNRLFQDSK